MPVSLPDGNRGIFCGSHAPRELRIPGAAAYRQAVDPRWKGDLSWTLDPAGLRIGTSQKRYKGTNEKTWKK